MSALIHAATMVTAGVFLMTRMNPMLAAAAPRRRTIIASSASPPRCSRRPSPSPRTTSRRCWPTRRCRQLGYMFLAVGSGAYVAAIFHMVTHAFFKALLFLGSGSVIHGMHHEQDMRTMGALRKLMPSPRPRSSSAGWPSPACRRSPASGRRTRSCCSRSPRAHARPDPLRGRPRHGAAHRVLHDPPGDHGVLRRGQVGGARRGARCPRRVQAARVARRSCCSRSSCSPACRSSAASSSCPRSGSSPTAGSTSSSTGSNRSSRRVRPTSPTRARTTARSCSRSLAIACALVGIAAADRDLREEAAQADRARDPRRGLALRLGRQRLHGWPRPQGVRGHRLVRQDRRRRCGQRRRASWWPVRPARSRKAQTGNVRNYAGIVGVGVVLLLAWFVVGRGVL